MGIDCAVNLLDQALQYGAGAAFSEFGSTVGNHVLYRLCPAYGSRELCHEVFLDFCRGNHVLYRLCPAYGSRELCHEVFLDFCRISVRQSVYVLVNRALRRVEVGGVDSSFQFYLSRIHQRRVESTAYLQWQGTLGAGCLHQFASFVDAFDGAGDNNLSRAVEVGSYANFAFLAYLFTDFLNLLVRQGDDGGDIDKSLFDFLYYKNQNDIVIYLNSDKDLYYWGTDGETPADKYDAVTLIVRELAKCFGIGSTIAKVGNKYMSTNTLFDNLVGLDADGLKDADVAQKVVTGPAVITFNDNGLKDLEFYVPPVFEPDFITKPIPTPEMTPPYSAESHTDMSFE